MSNYTILYIYVSILLYREIWRVTHLYLRPLDVTDTDVDLGFRILLIDIYLKFAVRENYR